MSLIAHKVIYFIRIYEKQSIFVALQKERAMKIELKKWKIEDKDELINLCNKVDRRYLSNHIPAPYETSDALAWISKVRQIDGIDGVYRAIVADGEIVGSISVERRHDIFCIDGEIGYMILPEHSSKGIATEAVASICSTAFFELSLRRISAVVIADNKASIRVLRKNGFELEGTMRRAATKDGNIYDICLLGRVLLPCPI